MGNKNKLKLILGIVVASVSFCSSIYAQARVSLTRVNGPDQTVQTDVRAEIFPGNPFDDPANALDSDPDYALTSNTASVSQASSSASVTTLISARCMETVGASTFAPTVDTTMNVSATTQGVGTAIWNGRAVAQATYTVNPPSNPAPPYVLESSLYLVANGGGSGETVLAASLTATAAGSTITASAFGPSSGWSISGTLRTVTGNPPVNGPPNFVSTSAGSLNHLFIGREIAVVTAGTNYGLTGIIGAPGGGTANGRVQGNNGGINRGFSADAWLAIY